MTARAEAKKKPEKKEEKIEDQNIIKDNTQDSRTLEEMFGELGSIITRMEEGDASLEESFSLYHQGMDLLKLCNDKIDRVEKQVLMLDEEGEVHEF